ncbi:hypothetical protein BV20DRAFT_1121307 [Pilatotrama ljubarskyi]|nr:hypothetical protein BV20DRAFT_1121307 [Pilatotrama ljubarskyi]
MRQLPAFLALASSLLAVSAAPPSVHVEIDIPIPAPLSDSRAEHPGLHRANHGRTASAPATESAFATIIDCDDFVQFLIPKAAEFATYYVQDAGVGGGPHGISSRYWFGAPDPEGYEAVRLVFKNVATNDFNQWTHRCVPQTDPEYVSTEAKHTVAYVDSDRFGIVNLCPRFFDMPVTGGHSMASVIVHEVRPSPRPRARAVLQHPRESADQTARYRSLPASGATTRYSSMMFWVRVRRGARRAQATHFDDNGPTDEVVEYGFAPCLQLRAIEKQPHEAIANVAASYEFFASNVFPPPPTASAVSVYDRESQSLGSLVLQEALKGCLGGSRGRHDCSDSDVANSEVGSGRAWVPPFGLAGDH